MKHKRFLVFGITNYYPCGGLDDLDDSFDTIEEARDYVNGVNTKRAPSDSYQIYDRIEGEEVK